MVRCLLFGATGFIGAHVRGHLAAAAGVEVVISTRPANGRGPVLSDAELRLDLATSGVDAVARLLRATAPDVVVNCAGATGGEVPALVAGNVVAVSALVAAVTEAAPGARLVHVGSAAEYGRVAVGTPVDESAVPDPVGPYGVTKLAGTALIGAAALDAVVLRVFNPIGPGTPVTSVPGRLAAGLRGDGEVRVGLLDGHRDFVDVRDVATAVAAAALAPGPLPPVLNVGSGQATAVREVADELVRLAGGARPIVETAAGSARSAGVPWQCADVRLAREVLGWSPAIDLATSLRDLWHT
jgi:nucleoside-diphosphate-sugar epimerase